MTLSDLLETKRDEIIRRWMDRVHGELVPGTMPHLELVDHLPVFIGQIIGMLRALEGRGSGPPESATERAGAAHGAQRLRLGFSLESVVREYGALRDALLAVALDAGLSLSFAQLQVIFDAVITGIAHAVSEYSRQRDAELTRQANEHFAFIAHELRNPLSSASTAFGILKGRGVLPPTDRMVGVLERSLIRTSDLVDQTLQTARVTSGIDLRRHPTTLTALFEEVEHGSASDAEAKNVTIVSKVVGDKELSLDTRLVRSALGNLLRNAVKYSRDGTTIELRGSVTGARAVVEVEDACGGLEPGKVEAAFAPFVRFDARQSGFGLGLAIAKQAVDAHGGSIRVQNLPGKGCVFVLELPGPPEEKSA
jgi:signal transduction histidine kinase